MGQGVTIPVDDRKTSSDPEGIARPAESPSIYQPLVLLDEVGKLFEKIIANHLIQHFHDIDLNLVNQYGFRQGRSTIDAIVAVKSQPEEAIAQGEVVLAVSLDITNAFNTLPWSFILETLRHHRVPAYLRRVVGPYFPTRSHLPGCGLLKAASHDMRHSRELGAGPASVKERTNFSHVSVVCYAVDTHVLAQ